MNKDAAIGSLVGGDETAGDMHVDDSCMSGGMVVLVGCGAATIEILPDSPLKLSRHAVIRSRPAMADILGRPSMTHKRMVARRPKTDT